MFLNSEWGSWYILFSSCQREKGIMIDLLVEFLLIFELVEEVSCPFLLLWEFSILAAELLICLLQVRKPYHPRCWIQRYSSFCLFPLPQKKIFSSSFPCYMSMPNQKFIVFSYFFFSCHSFICQCLRKFAVLPFRYRNFMW